MHGLKQCRAAAFTLVEMLAVIAIIGLLIGILVPAVSNARYQAQGARTQGLLSSLGDGCEQFQNENRGYPVSRGGNPFESSTYPGPPSVYLSGAEWLALQLAGPDLRGWVKPIKQNDCGTIGIDQVDWLHWYENQPTHEHTRFGPYVNADGKIAQTPEIYKREHTYTGPIPDTLARGGGGSGSSDWSNADIPFFVDAFGYPILYYVASAYAKEPISTGAGAGLLEGRYDQSDNAAFTGSQGGNGFYDLEEPGWDLGTGVDPDPTVTPKFHPMAILGYDPNAPGELPPRRSFTYSIFDLRQYEMTDKGNGGRIWPMRPDTFILISPGRDGRYGTLDDVRNF